MRYGECPLRRVQPRNQQTSRIRRFHDPGRMELHEFGIPDAGTREHSETEGVAGVLIQPRRGLSPDSSVTAASLDDCIGVDDHQ